jgi:hypothetical protein
MDFLHVMQDDELFSAYLHPHDEKTVSNVEVTNAMHVDSFLTSSGRETDRVCLLYFSIILSPFVLAFARRGSFSYIVHVSKKLCNRANGAAFCISTKNLNTYPTTSVTL